MFRIQLFGTPQIYSDQQPLKLERRKSRALLYYLAAHNDPLSREHLLAFFWPDHPRRAALQTLRTTLHGLRKVLGPALFADDDFISLSPDTQVDVRLFEQFFTAPGGEIQSLEQILELYQGDFLADFNLPDAQQFEDWVIYEREHFRRLAIRGLAMLSSAYEARQDYPAALTSLERALAFNPLQEDLQREQIRLYYLAGDRPGAIRRYDELRKLLDEEMGVPPMAETRALYDAIITDRLTIPARQPWRSPLPANQRAAPASDQLPFTGRSDELKTLQALAGMRKLTLIEGEPGIGKTRLAEEFIRTSNSLPLIGSGRELEQSLPYHPIVEALRGLLARPEWAALQASLHLDLPEIWLGEVGRLLPELAGSPGGVKAPPRSADESRLWEGINQFLHAIARQRPVILFLDDLHWADASTLALLGYLVRQPAAWPIYFLAAARPVPPRAPLASLLHALIREDCLARLGLSRLEPEAVNEIARFLNPADTGPLADWLQTFSEGNPYILVELVRHARENRLQNHAAGLDLVGLSNSPVVPQTVYSLIQSRLDGISETARRVLDAAVAAGREFEFEVTGQAAGLSESAALDALDELLAVGLIHPTHGGWFAFDHTLTMEVAYQEVGDFRHRLLHRRVAEALESVHRDRLDQLAGQLAWHFTEGNAPQRAAPYALRAGEQAVRLAAWTEAIAFFEQSLKGLPGEQQLPVLLALGEAHIKAGNFVQASEVFRTALNRVQPEQDEELAVKIQFLLAQSLLPQARFSEAIALAHQVCLNELPESVIDAELIWGTALSLEGSDLAEAEKHLQAADAAWAEGFSKDYSKLAQIKFELGSVAAQRGDLPQAIALYHESLAAASQSENEDAFERLILAHNNLAYHMLLAGDPAALTYVQAGLRLAEEKGNVSLKTYLLSTLGEIKLLGKDFEQAEQFFNEGLAIAERLSIPERVAGLTANLGLVAVQRGHTSLAIYRLSKALSLADTLGTRHLAAQVRLWLAPLLPPAEARARLSEARAIVESSGRRRLLDEVIRLEQDLFP